MKKRLLSFILAICMLLPCSLALTACGSNPPDNPHTHNWSTTWSRNSSEHWLTCDGCDEKKDKDNHDGDTCSICGYVKGTDPNPSIPIVANVRDLEIITAQAGTGSAILVKLPDGNDMLIDAGDDSYEALTLVEDLVIANVTDRTIEYFVLTNTNPWRTGGVPTIFETFTVLNFYRPDVRSGHADASSLSSEYNYGTAGLVEPSKQYADALTFAVAENGCVIKTISETSCDIDCTFKDSQGNTHNYKIDFMMPLGDGERDGRYDNTTMIAIQYKGITTLITSDATSSLIDAYCNNYGTKYDVDVLISSHNYTTGSGASELNYAISRSDLRGTNFLEKINLEFGEWTIVTCDEYSEGLSELIKEYIDIIGTEDENNGVLHYLNAQPFYNEDCVAVVTKVNSSGSLSVYDIETYMI